MQKQYSLSYNVSCCCDRALSLFYCEREEYKPDAVSHPVRSRKRVFNSYVLLQSLADWLML